MTTDQTGPAATPPAAPAPPAWHTKWSTAGWLVAVVLLLVSGVVLLNQVGSGAPVVLPPQATAVATPAQGLQPQAPRVDLNTVSWRQWNALGFARQFEALETFAALSTQSGLVPRGRAVEFQAHVAACVRQAGSAAEAAGLTVSDTISTCASTF